MNKFNNILPTQIGRGEDPTGHGYYGASRSYGAREHHGFDIVSTPGEKVFAPHRGKVRIGEVYTHTKLGKVKMMLVEITGEVYRSKLLYVAPKVSTGQFVEPGQEIGEAQYVTGYHTSGPNDPDKNMINHVHISTWKHGLLTDPEPLLKLDY